MKKLMTKLLLSCKTAVKMIDESDLRPLTFKEKIQLKLHLWVCKACRVYESQSQMINKLIKNFSDKKTQENELETSALEQKIQNTITSKS